MRGRATSDRVNVASLGERVTVSLSEITLACSYADICLTLPLIVAELIG